jgi:hypothetical protein
MRIRKPAQAVIFSIIAERNQLATRVSSDQHFHLPNSIMLVPFRLGDGGVSFGECSYYND